MILERIKSEGLAHLSYFIGQGNQAAVIDPRRDCQVYLDLAQQNGMRIRYIFETHRNEDYVTGSRELESLTGAEIFHGKNLAFHYGHKLKDGDRFPLDDMEIRALETPGHTWEHIAYALSDKAGEDPVAVFTGDALFVGDVGRTDFGGPEEAPKMAGALYDSIFNQLLPLGDEVLVFPAHGSGSVCGAGIAEREISTLGLERKRNPALWNATREDFVAYKVAEQHYYPPYFHMMEKYNLEGAPILGRLPSPPALGAKEFQGLAAAGSVVVDTRMPSAFGGAHIPGSYSIWLDGLPSFAGWVLSYDQPILLVSTDFSHVERAIRYLVRLGYDNVAGYLRDGMQGWLDEGLPAHHLGLLTVHELRERLSKGDGTLVLDVRRENEWEEGHIEGAEHIYVGNLEERLEEVPPDRPVAVLCGTGRRSSLGASILRRAGRSRVYNVLGSMSAWRAAGYPVIEE